MDGAPKTSHQPQSTCFLILVSSPEYSDFIFLLEGITEKPRMSHLDLNLLFGIYLLHGDLRDSQFANKCEAVCIQNRTCKVPLPKNKGLPRSGQGKGFSHVDDCEYLHIFVISEVRIKSQKDHQCAP